jgi:hypothetical protein
MFIDLRFNILNSDEDLALLQYAEKRDWAKPEEEEGEGG